VNAATEEDVFSQLEKELGFPHEEPCVEKQCSAEGVWQHILENECGCSPHIFCDPHHRASNSPDVYWTCAWCLAPLGFIVKAIRIKP
jgi:hypothetical protein